MFLITWTSICYNNIPIVLSFRTKHMQRIHKMRRDQNQSFSWFLWILLNGFSFVASHLIFLLLLQKYFWKQLPTRGRRNKQIYFIDRYESFSRHVAVMHKYPWGIDIISLYTESLFLSFFQETSLFDYLRITLVSSFNALKGQR